MEMTNFIIKRIIIIIMCCLLHRCLVVGARDGKWTKTLSSLVHRYCQL